MNLLFFAVVAMAMPQASFDRLAVLQSRMAEIALRQSVLPSGYWDPAQRDCSGLIRFVYRSVMGELHWKTKTGVAAPYVSAEELINFNFQPLPQSVDGRELRTGDVLVYYAAEKSAKDRWHLMLVVKSPQNSKDRVLAVYHNGGEGTKAGIRRVWLEDLTKAAGGEWRADRSNVRFKGFYRWQGWENL